VSEEQPSRADIERMIADIDAQISGVVDAILHHPDLQRLEASWRGLWHVVNQVAFDENIQVLVCHCTKDELEADLSDAAEMTTSSYFRILYTSEFGQFGGKPYSAVFANFEIDASPPDVGLLRRMASVSAMAHAPVLVSASPKLFDFDRFTELTAAASLSAVFETPHRAVWNAFRQHDDSRYVGVLLPRMLLRLPYGEAREHAGSFVYEERTVRDDDFLWGSPIFAFAVRLAQSFADQRTALGMLGAEGDSPAVRDVYPSLGYEKPAVEVVISRPMEGTLSELGFIPLMSDPHRAEHFFTTASSVQIPRSFARDERGAEGTDPTINFFLGTHLPYLFFATRFAHYIKVIERERIGGNRTRLEIERDLNEWISQYVAAMDSVSLATRRKRPLRFAHIKTAEVEGVPGWYRMEVLIQPHLRHMEHEFQLSVTGRIEKNQ